MYSFFMCSVALRPGNSGPKATTFGTVRYRINKAQEIITKKAPRDDFKETFSMALQIKCILERNK